MAFLLQNCQEPTRGCLDIEANNFDVLADRACENNCCKFPQLRLTVNQEYDGALWKEGEGYVNNLGKPFRLQKAAFYFSGFTFEQNGANYTVSDSIRLSALGTGMGDTIERVMTNDFVLVRRLPVEYMVGTFKQSGDFSVCTFQLGLLPEANSTLPRKAPSGHPLAPQAENFWQSNTDNFAWMQLVINRDTAANTAADTLIFTAADFPGGVPHEIKRIAKFQHVTGFTFPLIVTIDYALMFRDINFASISNFDLKMKIISNLDFTFDVE